MTKIGRRGASPSLSGHRRNYVNSAAPPFLPRSPLLLLLPQDAADVSPPLEQRPCPLDLRAPRRHRADQQPRRTSDPSRRHHPKNVLWLAVGTWLSIPRARPYGSRDAASASCGSPRLHRRRLSRSHARETSAFVARRLITPPGVNGYRAGRSSCFGASRGRARPEACGGRFRPRAGAWRSCAAACERTRAG